MEKALSTILDNKIESNVTAITAITNLFQGIEVALKNGANHTNVLSESLDNMELIPSPVISSLQEKNNDNYIINVKRHYKPNILSLIKSGLLGLTTKLIKKISVSHVNARQRKPLPRSYFKPQIAETINSNIQLLEATQAEKTLLSLPTPKVKQYDPAFFQLLHRDLLKWSMFKNWYSPDQTAFISSIARVYDDAWHTKLTPNEAMALTTHDFETIIATIRKLRKKVGVAELAVMILLALIVKKQLYKRYVCRSETSFYVMYADEMGISSS